MKRFTKGFNILIAALLMVAFIAAPAYAYTVKQVWARFSATAGETLVTGNVVMLKDSDGYAYKADANDAALRPAIGIVGSKGGASGVTVEIITSGILTGWTTLQEGLPGYLSETAAAITQTAPSYTQKIGIAVNTTDYLIEVEMTNPADAELSALAGLTSAANKIPYFTGAGTADLIASSANMVSLLGSADYNTARTNMGLAIGTDVQAYDADLTTYAGITPSANVQTLLGAATFDAFRTSAGLAIGTNVQAYDADLTTYAGITPTANVQTLLGSADYAAMRTALTLVPGTDVQAYDADLTTYAGITPSANVQTLLGAATFDAFRTSAGLAIGTNVQAYDADLTTYAGITPTANVQTLLGSADYAAMRTALTLVPGTDVQAYDADLTTYAGITPSANVQTLLGAATFDAFRTSAGLAIGTDVQAYDADLTTYAGITPSANVQTLLGAATFDAFRTSAGLAIGTNVQAYDADLATYAGITPTASAQVALGNAADGVVLSHRHRVIIAEINAGHELLPAIAGKSYRIIQALAIAYGGAVGATTTVDLLGTQSAGGVKLVQYAQANLTQSAVLTSGGTGATVQADGASYAACDVNTAITVGKTGADVTTATGVDFILTYVIE